MPTADPPHHTAAPLVPGPDAHSMPPRVAIVDPVSTGVHLAPAFRARGWSPVAVLSNWPMPRIYRGKVVHGDFDHVIVHSDAKATARQLRRLAVRAVVPGGELGVRLGDQLTELLQLPGNHFHLREARRDKAAMAEALAERGVAAPRTLRVRDRAEALAAARALGWPVVAKPADSAGSDQVYIARSPAAFGDAIDAILGSLTVFDTPNPVALVQQLLTGQQYAINTVSLDGRHYVAEVWRDRRTAIGAGRQIYDRMDLLPARGHLYAELSTYTRRALTALGAALGAAHTEVMVTGHGPVMIECGARLEGGALPAALQCARGQSQLSLLVDAYTRPDAFASLMTAPPPAGRRVALVFLAAPADGVIGDQAAVDRLRAIPGVYGVVGDLAPGRAVSETVCLTTCPAVVYLVADDAASIERAYAQIRALERAELYRGAAFARAA